MLRPLVALVLGFSVLGGVMSLTAEQPPPTDRRKQADQLMTDGQFREAYDKFEALCLDPANSGREAGDDLRKAINCLRRLNRVPDVDHLLDKMADVHKENWQPLASVGHVYSEIEHAGFLIAGKFTRGYGQGNGVYVNSVRRDLTRGMQLLEQARKLIGEDANAGDVASFYARTAQFLMTFNQGETWKLQVLTDLSVLPDYEEQQQRFGWRGGFRPSGDKGAPVNADGTPVFYSIPESFEAARNDGERWRFFLEAASRKNEALRPQLDLGFADFLQSQFGVQTLRSLGLNQLTESDSGDQTDPKANIWQLSTLTDQETIANLATGPKRFALPDDQNPVLIYQRLIKSSDQSTGAFASDRLAGIYEDRQQYARAAEVWKAAIETFGNPNGVRQARLDQIIKPWGVFESVAAQPAGKGATLDYRFRNGKKLSLEAFPIRIDQLLTDLKNELKSNPKELNWNTIQLDQIGYRLVEENQTKYLMPAVARWDVELDPREGHKDRRTTVSSPLQSAGAYYVVAKLDGGNVSRLVVWVNDTAILKKAVNNGQLYVVTDAVTGAALPGVNVEFFGWRHEYSGRQQRANVLTRNFAEKTDAQGLIVPDPKLMDPQYQWIAIAREEKRLAYLGFSGVWNSEYRNSFLNQTKVVLVTDRPVYRPEQKVGFKFWVRPVSYDLKPEQMQQIAGQPFVVQLTDPLGTEVWKKTLTADEYGGFSGEHDLPKGAKLGEYSLRIVDHPRINGGGSFKVEEYKKPEYLVEIDAPSTPVALGDKVAATIRAKYLFGAPVTNATVKYRVERTPHNQAWFPASRWDWLYGPGYWWFASDSTWYPGFGRWGCFAPRPSWIDWNPEPPELVLDSEGQIGADGTLTIEIDTSLAKALHGDQDHSYKITAEVVDASRRTIVSQGNVLVAREPFKVFVWLDRGYYQPGDTIHASANVRTLDGKPVAGTGVLKLLRVTYDQTGKPQETVAGEWKIDPDAQGNVTQEIKASESGQYRLSYTLTHEAEVKPAATQEGAYLFTIRGRDVKGGDFRFNDLELIPDRKEYAPGEKVQLAINTNRLNSTVLLFIRPVNGTCAGRPQVLVLDGKTTTVPIDVAQDDMPNFYVEAVTVSDGRIHAVTREIVVPPVQRVLNVEVKPSSDKYKPGQKADVEIRLTELNGEPFVGSLAVSMYDKAVEAIAGGTNVPDFKEHFWKWRRHHHPSTEHNLGRIGYHLYKSGEVAMATLGAFGDVVAETEIQNRFGGMAGGGRGPGPGVMPKSMMSRGAAPMSAMPAPSAAPVTEAADSLALGVGATPAEQGAGQALVEPTVRSQFADTAYWNGNLTTDASGFAKIELTMPENLTGWKIRTWAIGDGTRVGEATKEVTTSKDLLVRLQAPRFFVEKDTVMLSAIVHNYLPHEKTAQVQLVLEGDTLVQIDRVANPRPVTIAANGEARVNWMVKVLKEGEAKVTMKALTDEESDAMQMTFPVYVHGMLKTESFSGVVRPDETSGKFTIKVPAERRPDQTKLEIRYSPTLAGAMVDALPYLVDYPYGCTEQTLNRFLPTVVTQNILKSMKLDLAKIRDKRTNLNSQEIGDDKARVADWARVTKQWHRELQNPVFDEAEVEKMVKTGVADLTSMQLSDGGWGWFSGFGERSWPHTTCVVVHGLQIAQQNGVALVPGTLERGVEWLKQYQGRQVELLKTGEKIAKEEIKPEAGLQYKMKADNLDAFIYMVLVDADVANADMQRFLYRDRTDLSVYSMGLFGLALHKQQMTEQRDMVIRNIDQYLVVDQENQSAYLNLPNHSNYWWYWYGDSIEANAVYLKLLSRVNPQDHKAAGLVKYLLNNRKNSGRWNSTRDTATCIEALADYLKASGESQPNMLVEIWIDGEKKQSVEITPEVLFGFNNQYVVLGADLTEGEHTIELKRSPLASADANAKAGPLYYNAYLTNFTLEDSIKAAGLEIKVGRKFYRLNQRKDATNLVQGSKGQAIDQKALKYDREELKDLAEVNSGDLIEIELEIDSKNDYEYVLFEDLKAAGVEAVSLTSGYLNGRVSAYVEYRDERVSFFLRELPRGKHSFSYRVRAEIPGQFSALPTIAYAMYAPELKANADELKLRINDRPDRKE